MNNDTEWKRCGQCGSSNDVFTQDNRLICSECSFNQYCEEMTPYDDSSNSEAEEYDNFWNN